MLKRNSGLLLQNIRRRLRNAGKCLIVSASYYEPPTLVQQISEYGKEAIKAIQRRLLGQKRQFWGYLRTADEYRKLMLLNEFSKMSDGFLKHSDGKLSYWVECTR